MKVISNKESISQVNRVKPLNRIVLSLVGMVIGFAMFNGAGTQLKAQILSENEAVESKSETTLMHSPLTIAQSSNVSSANDKYHNLSQMLNCPQDQGQYGNFYDYGYWQGGSWCGQTGEPGYWVWANPNWYVWQDMVPAKASANGSYFSLVQVLNCPRDREQYGDYSNYGYWGGGSWCGQTGEPGYWTWVYPNWYVWKGQY
ncbi:MAG: hypothetical protein AAGF26_04480 [Cyanobacteria bacterium P01_G01_bin.49]